MNHLTATLVLGEGLGTFHKLTHRSFTSSTAGTRTLSHGHPVGSVSVSQSQARFIIIQVPELEPVATHYLPLRRYTHLQQYVVWESQASLTLQSKLKMTKCKIFALIRSLPLVPFLTRDCSRKTPTMLVPCKFYIRHPIQECSPTTKKLHATSCFTAAIPTMAEEKNSLCCKAAPMEKSENVTILSFTTMVSIGSGLAVTQGALGKPRFSMLNSTPDPKGWLGNGQVSRTASHPLTPAGTAHCDFITTFKTKQPISSATDKGYCNVLICLFLTPTAHFPSGCWKVTWPHQVTPVGAIAGAEWRGAQTSFLPPPLSLSLDSLRLFFLIPLILSFLFLPPPVLFF